jgi:hypothetical protein
MDRGDPDDPDDPIEKSSDAHGDSARPKAGCIDHGIPLPTCSGRGTVAADTGAIFGSGCWSPGQILFGVGPANATTPTVRFAAVSFTATLTYQMMITDTEIIRVDNLDRVDRLAKQ